MDIILSCSILLSPVASVYVKKVITTPRKKAVRGVLDKSLLTKSSQSVATEFCFATIASVCTQYAGQHTRLKSSPK